MGIKNVGLALAAMTVLGGTPDKPKTDKAEQVSPAATSAEISEPRNETHDLIQEVSEVEMTESEAAKTLASLKQTHPEIAKAGIDEAIISAIQSLGNGFEEFFRQFGPTGILTLAATFVFLRRRTTKGPGLDFEINEHPEIKAQLSQQAGVAERIADEMDELVAQPNPSEADKERLFAQATALTASMIVTLAPATASATGIWEGAQNAYHGVNTGIGEILNTIGRASESLGALGYAIDIIAVLMIGLGVMITADDFAKAWKALSNNHIRRNRALDRLTGPRRKKHFAFISTGRTKAGVATELLERVGSEKSDQMARNAGTVLRNAVSTKLPTEAKALKKRVAAGELDVSSINEHSNELAQLKDQILEILNRDYSEVDRRTGKQINYFPQREFNDLIQRFNTLANSLKSTVEPRTKDEMLKWKNTASIGAYVLIAALSVGWLSGSVKGHLGTVSENGQVTAPAGDPGKPSVPDNPYIGNPGTPTAPSAAPTNGGISTNAPAPVITPPAATPQTSPDAPVRTPQRVDPRKVREIIRRQNR